MTEANCHCACCPVCAVHPERRKQQRTLDEALATWQALSDEERVGVFEVMEYEASSTWLPVYGASMKKAIDLLRAAVRR